MSKDGYRMPTKPFTDKHKELFPYLAQGMSYAEIARTLGITPMSVRQRVDRMMDIAKCTPASYAQLYSSGHQALLVRMTGSKTQKSTLPK